MPKRRRLNGQHYNLGVIEITKQAAVRHCYQIGKLEKSIAHRAGELLAELPPGEIETCALSTRQKSLLVAPHAGAWIETDMLN